MPSAPLSSAAVSSHSIRPLKGVRILSLALNLPGPAALMRCRAMGASCVKIEPPAPSGMPRGTSGDPMASYSPAAYQVLQQGIRTRCADLKTEKGRAVLHRELARADVLLTSFRPSALNKLGLGWKELHKAYPQLSMVAIIGAPGARAEEPGHDLTYMAENGLVTGLDLPASLYADMGGSLVASEAILQVRLQQLQKGRSVRLEVALSEAAGYLGLPLAWGLTTPGTAIGGGHAGYRMYACKDGRVAMAALEPHFAARLACAAGLANDLADAQRINMSAAPTHAAIASFLKGKTRKQLDALALAKDLPLHTMK